MKTIGRIILWLVIVAASVTLLLMLIGAIALMVDGEMTLGTTVILVLFVVVPLVITITGACWGIARLKLSRAPAPEVQKTPVGPGEPVAPPVPQHTASADKAAAQAERLRRREERRRLQEERRRRREEERRQREAAARAAAAAEQERRAREGYMSSGDWVPPRPTGRLFDAWAPGRGLEVVGEAWRPDAFRRLMGRQAGFRTYEGAELVADAILVPDPLNPHGKCEAVAVYVGGEHVGYLAQEDAHKYYPPLAAAREDGMLLRVPARTWASATRPDRVNARVTLQIPEPSGLTPSNGLPDRPFVVIPAGRKIQVTKEDEHMEVLARYVLRGSGVDNYVAATLRTINEIRPRSAYEAVQVELGGERVGVLTKGQSEKLLPLVRHIEQRGKLPVVRAVVTGSKLKADAVLLTADATTVDDAWVDSLGEAVTEANVDRRPEPPKRPDFDWDDEGEE